MQYVCQKVVYNRNGQDFIAEVHNIAGDFEKYIKKNYVLYTTETYYSRSKLDPEFKSIKPEEDSKNSKERYRHVNTIIIILFSLFVCVYRWISIFFSFIWWRQWIKCTCHIRMRHISITRGNKKVCMIG